MRPQRRVGSDAGKRVRSTAIETDHQLRSRNFRAFFARAFLHQGANVASGGFERARGAAALLKSHAYQTAGPRRGFTQIVRNLVRFAAKAENDGCRNVWVGRTPASVR